MSTFVAADEFALAAASVGLTVRAVGLPGFAAEIAGVREAADAAGTVRVTAAATAPPSAEPTASPATEPSAHVILFPPCEPVRLTHELTSRFGKADILVLTGQMIVGRECQPFALVARPAARTQALIERLSRFDPLRRPAIVGVTADLAMPFHGANLYPGEESGGYVMRWIGPEPVLRIDLKETFERLARVRPASVRVEVGVALVYSPALLAGLRVRICGRTVPHLVRPVGGRRRISALVPGEALDVALESGEATLELAAPFTLKEMPQALDGTARSLSLALSDIEFIAHHGPSFWLPPASAERLPSIADALAAIARSPTFARDGFPALLARESENEEEGRRFVALNAVVGGTLFHRLEVVETGEGADVFVEAATERTTSWGYCFLAPTPRRALKATRRAGLPALGEGPDADLAAALALVGFCLA